MTLEQKAGQLNQEIHPTTPEAVEIAKEKIRKGEVGSFIMAV